MESEVENPIPFHPWKNGLPDNYTGDVVIPVRF